MSADHVDHRGLLTDEQMTGPMQRQATLLVWRLGRHEPHVRSGDCLADRLGVSGIVLMPLYIRLHIGRRHQANGVAKHLEFARPMMRRGAGFHTDQAWRYPLEVDQHVTPLELTEENHIALRIDAMNLENRLRDVETDRRDRLMRRSPITCSTKRTRQSA